MTQMNPSPERPLLSFAVPTYNRAKYLDQLLGVLLKQLHGESRVEVIVSDNASTDNTPTVVEAYKQQGLDIRYLRNETNLGPDKNFLQCFEQSRGRYFWLFGDDDSIAPCGLEKVIEIITEDEEYDLIFLVPNRQSEHRSSRHVVTHPIDFSQLINTRLDLIFISSMIINKDRTVLPVGASCVEMVGSHVIQLSWVFAALRNMTRGLFVDDCIVIGGLDLPSGGFNAASVFIVNYLKAMDLWLGNDQSLLKEALINDLMVFWFRNWIWMRKFSGRGGSISTHGSHQMVQVLSGRRLLSGRRIRYWLFVFPLVCLPVKMASFWNRLLMVARRFIRNSRDAHLARKID